MSERKGSKEFYKLLENAAVMHETKSHDYASDDNPFSNFEIAAQLANTDVNIVFRVMIGIKLARIDELNKGKTPKNEALQDTFVDLFIYTGLYTAYQEFKVSRNKHGKIKAVTKEELDKTYTATVHPEFDRNIVMSEADELALHLGHEIIAWLSDPSSIDIQVSLKNKKPYRLIKD